MHRELSSMEELVLQNLLNGDTEAQIQAAAQLGNLNGKQRHNLAERGVMLPLISMLHSQDFETIEAALFALLTLAFGSERLVFFIRTTSQSRHIFFNLALLIVVHITCIAL
jgi:hypothetical protein